MAASNTKANFTEYTIQAIRESSGPLSFEEIVQRVLARTSVRKPNFRATIRNAISQSRSVLSTGDGRYGWKPRLITGSVLRHTLKETELQEKVICYGEELRDAIGRLFLKSRSVRTKGRCGCGCTTATRFGPEHEEHDAFLEWNGPFDPEAFDAKSATQKLRSWRRLW